jgi:hypothetical protein
MEAWAVPQGRGGPLMPATPHETGIAGILGKTSPVSPDSLFGPSPEGA